MKITGDWKMSKVTQRRAQKSIYMKWHVNVVRILFRSIEISVLSERKLDFGMIHLYELHCFLVIISLYAYVFLRF